MITDIAEQVRSVLMHSQGKRMNDDWLYEKGPVIDDLLIKWAQNKQHLFKLFGGKYIVEHPEEIEISIPDSAMESMLRDFCMWLDNCIYPSRQLCDFIEAMKIEDVFDNVVSYNWTLNDGFVIPKGMKLSKSFKFFFEDESTLRTVQDKFSGLTQQKNLKGILCLSIHPMDYLTSSENVSNWRSCHALDGEYCSGNLSYMCDESTIVCYLKSKEDVQLPHLPQGVLWNNKKWRMLVHISNGKHSLMLAGRQYPCELVGIKELIAKIIGDLRIENQQFHSSHVFDPWDNTSITSIEDKPLKVPHRYVNGLLKPLRDFVHVSDHSLHYNDAFSSHIYQIPHLCWDRALSFRNYMPTIEIGPKEPIKCIRCGNSNISYNDCMLCYDCAEAVGYYEF